MKDLELILVRGCPGSGKSTFSDHLVSADPKNFVHYENDMFHMTKDGVYKFVAKRQPLAVKWCYDMTNLHLASGKSVVVSNTFTRNSHMESYRDLARKYNAILKIYRMTGDFGNTHNVPIPVLESMRDHFEDCPGEMIVHPLGESKYKIET